METDLLSKTEWECCSTQPDEIESPEGLDKAEIHWWPASVPGTAAGALRSAHQLNDDRDFDSTDWWFRCRFPGPETATGWLLHLGGLATIADVWLNTRLIDHSENMFVAREIEVDLLARQDNELCIRFRALGPLLAQRRPRPRWKTYLLDSQNFRWIRTSLLGRLRGWSETPAPVGPWRPVTLTPKAPVRLLSRQVVATCDGEDGIVSVSVRIRAAKEVSAASLHVGEASGPIAIEATEGELELRGSLLVRGVRRWWPHTHGDQPLYAASIDLDGHTLELGRVGFRTVEVERDDGAFNVVVNGVRVFCRGACWTPPDPVSLTPGDHEVRSTLELARSANMNMIRIPGTLFYEDERFWDLCDELGLLVWQDCMLAYYDPPEDAAFTREVERELAQVLSLLGGRPSLTIICGSQEVEEQAAMLALPRERWSFPLIQLEIPMMVSQLLPDVPYIASNPTGGELPFQMDTGVSQYFGVGGYMRTLGDLRQANVRFAAECLAFSNPPERETVDEACGGPTRACHDPQWKRAVHHDAGRSWDMEDVRDHYVRQMFEIDPLQQRVIDPERALDLGRATNAELMSKVMSEWRQPDSACGGGLVLALRDFRPGAGWGVIDALGRPKSPWYALKRTFAPVAVIVTDEGLNGYRLHLMNDTEQVVRGTLRLELYSRGELRTDLAERPVEIPPRGRTKVEAVGLLDGFRDITYSYRFTPPSHDVVVTTLLDADGSCLSQAVELPLGMRRELEREVGLVAVARPTDDGKWQLEVSTRRFAQFVSVDVPGYLASDSWFHLPPGSHRSLALEQIGDSSRPVGHVRALNSEVSVRVDVEDR